MKLRGSLVFILVKLASWVKIAPVLLSSLGGGEGRPGLVVHGQRF